MMELTRGDLLRADVEAIVNPVNCVGVMGAGLALQVRRAYAEGYVAYAAACRRGEVTPGRMFVTATGRPGNPRWVIHFPTKRHWREPSRLADLDAGLPALVAEVRRLGVRSVAVPPLGCGLGGLDWNAVRPRIEAALSELADVRVLLFEPVATVRA